MGLIRVFEERARGGRVWRLAGALRAGMGFVEGVGVGVSGPGDNNRREGSLARVDAMGEDGLFWNGSLTNNTGK